MHRRTAGLFMAMLTGWAIGLPHALASQQTPISIADARADSNGDGYPDRAGQTLTVEGVVTYEPYSARGGAEVRVYVEDGPGGLRLLTSDSAVMGELARGDRVRATGQLGQDRGMDRLVVTRVTLLGHGDPPSPLSVSLSEIELRAEELSGRLIRVVGRPRRTSPTTLVLVEDGGDDELRLYLRPSVFTDPTGQVLDTHGGELEAIGILEQADPNTPPTSGYRITPRSRDDVRQAGLALLDPGAATSGAPSDVISVAEATADADGDYYPDLLGDSVTLEGVITYERYRARGNTEQRAYLQDASGGIRLLSFVPDPLSDVQRWDRVRVRGVVGQNNGMPLLMTARATVLSAGDPIEPRAVSVTTVLDSAEAMTGRLIRVRGRPELIDHDVRLVADGGALRLYLRGSVFPDEIDQELLKADLEIEAVGILEQNDGSAPLDSGYRLTARGPADLVQIQPNRAARVLVWSLLALLLVSGGFGWYIRASRRRARAREALVSDLRTSETALLSSQAELREEMAQKELAEEARRHAELQLLQSQKMESLGTLAGGIAHDFNNLLTVMLGHVDLLLDANDLPDDVTDDVEEIQKAGERARDLVRQILAFSRRQVLETRQIHLDDFVESDRSLLRRLLREDVELRLDLASNAHVSADTTQLTQVLVNLAANARDAMPRGGTLTIRTSTRSLVRALEEGSATVPPGRYVVLEVADTGVGMDEGTLRRAFDPFYTTKEVGAGTGLGLATVHGIVKQSDGHLTVTSTLGSGTTFSIYLPCADPEPTPALEDADTRVARFGKVLLVEDEELVRKITARMLGRIFDEVLEATNGKEALDVIAEQEGDIDMVVTDAIMPGMGGVQLVARLAKEAPGLPVLLLSGYPDPAAGSAYVDPDTVETLTKPVSLASLTAKISAVLDG